MLNAKSMYLKRRELTLPFKIHNLILVSIRQIQGSLLAEKLHKLTAVTGHTLMIQQWMNFYYVILCYCFILFLNQLKDVYYFYVWCIKGT